MSNRFITWEFQQVEEEFRIKMLVDDMNISVLMVFSQQKEKSNLRRRKRGLYWTMMDPIGMVILKIDKCFSDMFIIILVSIIMRGCLTLDHKWKLVSPYGLLVLGVVMDMRVGIWHVEIVVMVWWEWSYEEIFPKGED